MITRISHFHLSRVIKVLFSYMTAGKSKTNCNSIKGWFYVESEQNINA